MLTAVSGGCDEDGAPKPDPAAAAGEPATKEKDTQPDAKADAKTDEPPAPPPLPEPKLIEPMGEPKGESAAKIQVQLPPSPDFDESQVPDRHPDGSWSIAGIRADLDTRVAEGDAGKEITIKAYVAKIYVPPECPEGEACPPPKQPHVWIADDDREGGLKRAMMLVNYRFTIPEWEAKAWKAAPDVVLMLGKQYTFKGKVRTFSDTGFAHADGLVEFVAYKPLDPETGGELPDWVYPPGAPWHPQEIARQEEANRELAEKLAKEMKK